jgi:hypothetical protein
MLLPECGEGGRALRLGVYDLYPDWGMGPFMDEILRVRPAAPMGTEYLDLRRLCHDSLSFHSPSTVDVVVHHSEDDEKIRACYADFQGDLLVKIIVVDQ